MLHCIIPHSSTLHTIPHACALCTPSTICYSTPHYSTHCFCRHEAKDTCCLLRPYAFYTLLVSYTSMFSPHNLIFHSLIFNMNASGDGNRRKRASLSVSASVSALSQAPSSASLSSQAGAEADALVVAGQRS